MELIKMTNKNYLTTEAYTEMAEETMSVIEDLRLIQNALEFIRHPKEVIQGGSDMTVEYYKVYQYTDNLYPKVQGLIKTLEDIGGTLYSVGELEELQEFVRAEWLIEEETFKTFAEFKNDPNKNGVTVKELTHYQKQGYTTDEILRKPTTKENETNPVVKFFDKANKC